MSQRRVEVADLVGHIVDILLIGMMIDGAHQGETVDNHQDDDADVFGKSEQKIAEILAADERMSAVERRDLVEAVDNLGNISAPLFQDGLARQKAVAVEIVKHHGHNHVAVGPESFAKQLGGRHVAQDGIEAEAVAMICAGLSAGFYNSLQTGKIAVCDGFAAISQQRAAQWNQFCLFILIKKLLLHISYDDSFPKITIYF